MENKQYKITIENMEDEAELSRTLSTLFSTREGSQPADREFGIAWGCLDEVPEVAESLFYLEAVRKVERYEPRAEVGDIVFEHVQVSMIPHIYFTRRDD